MSAEQTPDIAAVLAEHEGWPAERYDARGTYYVMCCDCGWEEPKQPDAYEGSSNHRHRAHIAAALAPVLDAAVREAEQRALREAADDFKDHQAALSRSTGRLHTWTEAVRYILDRADRITEPVSHEAATSGEEASKA